MAPPVGIIEAHIKSELFNNRILPDEFVQYLVGAKRRGTLAEIFELLLQRYLPAVSLCHALLALVTPESYDRSNKLGRAMTLEAIEHRNNLVPRLTAELLPQQVRRLRPHL
eukprot:4791892-Amphidinium_carterae.1